MEYDSTRPNYDPARVLGDVKLPIFSYDHDPRQVTHDIEELPFFGPLDPPRWPLHKTLFLGGILFPPLWFVGAFMKVRDTHDNWAELFRMRCQAAVMVLTIVLIALIVLETAFRDT